MANCWALQTPVQLLLTLILMVSVPFLIGMIVVYALYSSSQFYPSEQCARLCCSYRNEIRRTFRVPVHRVSPIPFEYADYEDLYPKSTNKNAPLSHNVTSNKKGSGPEKASTFVHGSGLQKRSVSGTKAPLIGYLVENRTTDIDNQEFYLRVLCPAGIISPNWALADADCFGNIAQLTLFIEQQYTPIEKLVKNRRVLALRFQALTSLDMQRLLQIQGSNDPTSKTLMIYYSSWSYNAHSLEESPISFVTIQVAKLTDPGSLLVKMQDNQITHGIYVKAFVIDQSNRCYGLVFDFYFVGERLARMSLIQLGDYLPWLREADVIF